MWPSESPSKTIPPKRGVSFLDELGFLSRKAPVITLVLYVWIYSFFIDILLGLVLTYPAYLGYKLLKKSHAKFTEIVLARQVLLEP